MRSLFFLLIFLLSSSASLADESELHLFTKSLDSTLKKINRSECLRCLPQSQFGDIQISEYDGQKVSVVSEKQIQKIFAELKKNKDIPYGFTVAGCDEKSHEISRLLLLQGITPLKGFLKVADPRSDLMKVAHPSKPGKFVEFYYHVAPVILVHKNGKNIPYSIDPTYEQRAVPTLEWQSRFTKLNAKARLKLEYRSADSYGEQGRKIDFADPEINRSNLEALKEFKRYSELPNGEDEWLNMRQMQEWKMNSAD